MSCSTTASSIFLVAVSFIEPTATPSFIDAQAQASYIQPCVSVSYTQIRVCAEVTFPDVLAVDVVTPADQVYLDVSKALADSLSQPTDALTLSTGKAIAESVVTADSIQTTLIYIRTFAEDIFAVDAPVLDITKPTSDTVVIGEDSTYALDKTLSELVSITDNMDTNIQHLFIKVVNEFTVNTDAQVIDFTSDKADNIATGSSGYLLMQDYCDITYFLEDYVGSYRTFT